MLYNFRCFSCLKSDQINLDNCCQCNTAAFKKTTGLSHDDIVYASFKNDVSDSLLVTRICAAFSIIRYGIFLSFK